MGFNLSKPQAPRQERNNTMSGVGGVRTQIPGLGVSILNSSPLLGTNMLCDLELVT